MKSKIRFTLILLIVAAIAFVAGRSSSVPVPPNLPAPFDPVAIGLEGKRVALAIDMWPLEKVVEHLSVTYGKRIEVDWKGLEAAGVDRSSPVVLAGDNLNLTEALCRIDHQFRDLTWTTRDGAIVLARDDLVRAEAVIQIYDLRPLYRTLNDREFNDADEFEQAAFTSGINLAISTAFSEEADDFGQTYIDDEQIGGFVAIRVRPYDHVRIARLLNWLAAKRGIEAFRAQYRAYESPEAGRW